MSSLIRNSINSQVIKSGYVGIFIKDQSKLQINEVYQRNTPVPVASISKPFTAFSILKLVDLGVIKLNDPVARYFPDLFEFRNMKGGVEITVRDLLQHTSGIPYEGKVAMVKISIGKRNYVIPNQVAIAGTKFIYSNYNYRLLAKLVEKTIGQSLSDFLIENLFEPLDIVDYNLESFDGAAGLEISPQAIYKFSKMILSGGVWEGKRLISRKKIKYFVKPPRFTKTKPISYYGIGWTIYRTKNKIEFLTHKGKGDYSHSVLKIYPRKAAISMLFTLQTRKNPKKFNQLNTILEQKLEKYFIQLDKLEEGSIKK
ncbi:MAG: serine hydrolase [Leptospiraceae bacterium]|nr:serine hydrolase [Leptospiraceae bacterium]